MAKKIIEEPKKMFLIDFLDLKQQSRAMVFFHTRNYQLINKGDKGDKKTIAEWSQITGL